MKHWIGASSAALLMIVLLVLPPPCAGEPEPQPGASPAAPAAVGPLAPARAAESSSVAAVSSHLVGELPLALRLGLRRIEPANVVRHVAALCSKSMLGRQAGEPGALLAARYVADEFRAAGLQGGGVGGSYFQPFALSRAGVYASLRAEGKDGEEVLLFGADFQPMHLGTPEVELRAGLEFVDYGLRLPSLGFDSLQGRDLKGKVALAFGGVPWSGEARRWLDPLLPDGALAAKARAAQALGASALLVVDDPADWREWVGYESTPRMLEAALPPDVRIPVVHLRRAAACRLSGLTPGRLRKLAHEVRRGRAALRRPPQLERSVMLRLRRVKPGRYGRNVIGVLVGSGPRLRDEAVVVGAHLDHLGVEIDGLHPGANDNASGVSAVIEIARTLGALPLPLKPRRTVVLVAFDAEEIGRLGSAYYVATPPLPLDRTALMINFDMIGRNEPDHIWAVATRSSPTLHQLHQEANRHVGLRLKHPEFMRLSRSDHGAFYRAGVPVCYFFGGLHDGYHSPRDTPDLVSSEKVARVARLALLTAWGTANRDEPLDYVRQESDRR